MISNDLLEADSVPARPVRAPRRTLLFSLVAASIVFLFPLLSVPLLGSAAADGWRSLGLRGETVMALAAVSGENGALLFVQTPSGLWRKAVGTTDNGRQGWTRIDRDLPHSLLGAPLLAAWRNVPGRPLQLYALAGPNDSRQLFRTEDGGSTWRAVGPAPGQSRAPAMTVLPGLGQNPDVIIIATQTRVQRSDDGGATWAPGGEWPIEGGEHEPVLALVSEPTGLDRLLALERSGRLWFSDSGGLSWHDIGGESEHMAIATAPYFGQAIWTASGAELLRTGDDGLTWSRYPLPASRGVMSRPYPIAETLGVDPRVPDTVYAALASGSIYRLGSGQAAWQPLGAPPSQARCLAVDPASRDTLYAGTDDGVWARSVIADQPTVTPSPAATATIEPSATASPTATVTATATATSSSTPTLTPTSAPIPSSTAAPSATPPATFIAAPTTRPTRQPTGTATPTVVIVPTATPELFEVPPPSAESRDEPAPTPTLGPR